MSICLHDKHRETTALCCRFSNAVAATRLREANCYSVLEMIDNLPRRGSVHELAVETSCDQRAHTAIRKGGLYQQVFVLDTGERGQNMADNDVLANQKTILENQATILTNQKTILDNQASIAKNQAALDQILKNQELILAALKK
jgi:hypothetical protein